MKDTLIIDNNTILGTETFHSMKTGHPFLEQDYMEGKLDMMKAYDKIKRSYLDSMLREVSFLDRVSCSESGHMTRQHL